MEENTPTGRPIGDPVAADDDDVGDTLTYTLDDGADAGAFDIDELSGQLRTKTPLDYDEGKRSYSMTLTATDTSGEDDSIAVRVAVTNINEPPELSGPTAVDYDENNRGTVASYTAVDPERTTITWTLAGDDQDDFQISSRCVLTFSATPDYETPTDSGGNNTYEVTVQASDGTNTPTQAVTVSVINLDRGRHRHGHNNNQPPASGHRSGSHPRRPRPRNPKHAGAEIVADSAYASGAALDHRVPNVRRWRKTAPPTNMVDRSPPRTPKTTPSPTNSHPGGETHRTQTPHRRRVPPRRLLYRHQRTDSDLSRQPHEEVLTKTLEETPRDATHWSTRSMAKAVGLSQSSISRIWRAFGLKPHRTEHFKLSPDPQFVDKVRDAVGLYLNPPDAAVVLCVDEKTQIQALDRTAPILPLLPGTPQRATHDYKRNGTTNLYTALDTATGKVITNMTTAATSSDPSSTSCPRPPRRPRRPRQRLHPQNRTISERWLQRPSPLQVPFHTHLRPSGGEQSTVGQRRNAGHLSELAD